MSKYHDKQQHLIKDAKNRRKKQDDIINNIIVTLAVLLMIAICAGIYVVTSYLEAVNY